MRMAYWMPSSRSGSNSMVDTYAGGRPERSVARAGAAATRFRQDPGDAVVLCDESSPAVPISLFGAAWAGKPYIPLNYRLPDPDLCPPAARPAPEPVVFLTGDMLRATPIDELSRSVSGAATVVVDATGRRDVVEMLRSDGSVRVIEPLEAAVERCLELLRRGRSTGERVRPPAP